jgi:signal transduction histidine kinase
MKFTVEGIVRLSAVVVGSELHIQVSDTGVGIAPTDQERVFEKFQQVGDTLTGKPKGTGLGLTICRDIVAHHGGRLLLDSQRGRGSTFTVALPVMVAALAAAA